MTSTNQSVSLLLPTAQPVGSCCVDFSQRATAAEGSASGGGGRGIRPEIEITDRS